MESKMTDYISREAAIEAMYELCNKDQRQIFTREQLLALDDVPAADVREVKRGHWIGLDEFPHEDWECDVCGSQAFGNDRIPQEFHFCPNCGADMREEQT